LQQMPQMPDTVITKRFGVRCKTVKAADVLAGGGCKTVFEFQSVECDGVMERMEYPCPPLGGLECPTCGLKHQYGSDDVVVIGLLPSRK